MFPFRKPPTKLEIAKRSVSDAAQHLLETIPTHQIEEKIGDLKKGAVVAAGAASLAAHHAGEVAAQKFGELHSAASHLGEGVVGAAQTAQTATQNAATVAAAKAGAATQSARGTLGEKAKALSQIKERAAHDFALGGKEAQNAKAVAQKAAAREAEAIKARTAALEARKQAKKLEKEADSAQRDADDTASQAKQAAARAVDEARAAQEKERADAENQAALEAEAEAAAQAQAEAEALNAKMAKKQAKAEARARAWADEADLDLEKTKPKVARQRDDEDRELAEVQISDGGSKTGWILLGLAVGAVLALLLAPTSGRRSRAAIKDRLGKVSDGAVDAVTATSDKVVDIAQRVEGLSHKVEAKLAADGETDDDTTVADRVRSVLGHHEIAKGLERLNIDCVDGVVTLRGPMLDEATQEALITAIKTVPGVQDVVADFLTDEAPEDPKDSVI